jgi:uncharacterized protein
MTIFSAALLFLAALLAGTMNSVAGGGSFFSFPALLFTGVPPIPANATNTVAVWPGSVASAIAYRNELCVPRWLMVILGCSSLAGGLLGALLLLHTPEKTFVKLLPFLLLLATLLFAFSGRITRYLRGHFGRRVNAANPEQAAAEGPVVGGWMTVLGVGLLQLVIATYGGYFGGGIGIMMLATLSLLGMENIHMMNALKTLLASLINGVAVITFILAGAVLWPQAVLMITGAIIGGYGGAYYARRLDPRFVRGFVISVGCAMTVYFFLKP